MTLRALGRWVPGEHHADEIFSSLAASLASEADRAFAKQLLYGIVRNLSLLDFVIGLLVARELDPPTRSALRLGVYQLLFTRVPPHAAVHETVDRAGRAKALVNAALRRFTRERAAIEARIAQAPVWIRESHPRFLYERWSAIFGPENADALCRWNNSVPDLFVRANLLRGSAEALCPKLDAPEKVEGHPSFFKVPHLPREAIAAGLCYVQDPGTMLACMLLDARPGERILDLCAAPGGKTGVIAQQMEDRGEIVACDSKTDRLARLEENMNRLGIGCVRSFQWNALDPRGAPEGAFDRVLVDAPCSNTGVMRRRLDVRWRLTPEEFPRLAAVQLDLLRRAAGLLKPEGVLVYSTCSIDPEENERVVAGFLASEPGFELGESGTLLPVRDGRDGAYAAKLRRAP